MGRGYNLFLMISKGKGEGYTILFWLTRRHWRHCLSFFSNSLVGIGNMSVFLLCLKKKGPCFREKNKREKSHCVLKARGVGKGGKLGREGS